MNNSSKKGNNTGNNTGRDIRRINGKLYDFTDTHDNKFGGTNNKRPKLIREDQVQPQYRESKAFKVFIGIVVGLALMSGLGQAISGLYDSTIGKAQDTIKISKDVADLGKSTSSGDTTVRNEAATKLEDDVLDILKDELKDALLENNMPESISTITVVDYKKVEDKKGYTKNVVNKIEDGTHTFAIIMSESLTNENESERKDNIIELMEETNSLVDGHNCNMTGGIHNIPRLGDYIMLVTYIAE